MKLINRRPGRQSTILLGALPFVLLIVTYAVASHFRRIDNPADKILPSLEAMGTAFHRMAFVPSARTGELLLWVDTADSLMRLGAGIGVSTLMALTVGLLIGTLPHARAGLSPFVASMSLIPPITILPILFIIFGLGETSKVMLIVVGTAPVMIRSMSQAVLDIPRELVIKAQTLGANTWQIVIRLFLPQILPKLILAIRLGLIPAWIFLVSAEAIASTTGLGYRIFLVRRYLAMDLILPYVVWITVLAYLIDRVLLWLSKRGFRWHHLEGESL
ncbi:MAG: ABC transporter permease subunit [Alphaproteobacteria bacterium]|nr:ABC transporter permease subunit [Alphaproteobacteria bacterium]